MKKVITLAYGSRYGSTLRYARWIADELEAAGVQISLLPCSELGAEDLTDTDALVAGLSDYGGLLTGATDLKRAVAGIGDTPLFLFTVSFSGLEGVSREKLDNLLRKNLGEGPVNSARATFHFRGSLDHTRLSLAHRAVMVGIRSAIATLPNKTLANQQLLDSFALKTVDYSSPEQSQPLARAVLSTLGLSPAAN